MPMACISKNDYFIYEPAVIHSCQCCILIWWFTRGGVLLAKFWKLREVTAEQTSGWRVIQSEDYKVPLHNLIKNFTDLQSDAVPLYGLLSPTSIIGMSICIFNPISCQHSIWTFTDPSVRNCWHTLSHGVHIVAFPIWMIHPVICQRNGMNITAFSSYLLGYLVSNLKRNIIYISSLCQTLLHLQRCS
ncbi:hypothetical protein L208DRAFT_1470914, partial [Tricholoma matsutake]